MSTGKNYKSKVCVKKHLWEHSVYWDLFDGLKKQQRVLSIQAAIILAIKFNPSLSLLLVTNSSSGNKKKEKQQQQQSKEEQQPTKLYQQQQTTVEQPQVQPSQDKINISPVSVISTSCATTQTPFTTKSNNNNNNNNCLLNRKRKADDAEITRLEKNLSSTNTVSDFSTQLSSTVR